MPNRYSFDELNTLSDGELIELLRQFHIDRNGGEEPALRKRRSMDYREFFGDMYLDPEEKEKRIAMAEELARVFLMLFVVLAYNGGIGDGLTYSDVYKNVEERSFSVIENYIAPDGGGYKPVNLSPQSRKALEDSIKDYVARQTRYVVDNTVDHFSDDYYTSDDRAAGIAENQTNGITNDSEMFEAIDGGFTHKTWVTMHDKYVRDTHQEVDGVTIPIEEPFQVGDSQLLFPGDDSLGAGADELANCRCTVEYSSEGKDEE